MKKILLSFAAIAGIAYSGIAQPVLSQNFEGGTVAPWTVATTGGGTGWGVTTGATSTQLGAIPAHTHYALVNEALNGSTAFDNPSIMTSPTFSLVGVSAPYLAYDYLYFGAYLTKTLVHEHAWVQISTDGGSTYSFLDSVTKATVSPTPWATKFVSLGTVTPTANCKLQFCYQDDGSNVIGVAIDNIVVYSSATTDIGISSVAPIAGDVASYYLVGSSATISGVATNYSSSPISSYTANYKVGSGTTVSSTITTAIPAFSTGSFTITTPYAVTAPATNNVSVWVTTTGETYLNNDTMGTSISGYAFQPKKRVLFEEGTGAWCGFCVRGIVFMDSLNKLHGNNVSIISVHDALNGPDGMANDNSATTAYDKFVTAKIGGYPSMVIDRRYTSDPDQALVELADTALFGFADMTIKGAVSGSTYTATVTVTPALALSGDYRVELVVTEDSVTGTSSTFAQHNYYGVGGAYNSTMMTINGASGYNFNTLPQVIPAGTVKFPYVARYTLPNDLTTTANGVAGSLPSSMTASTAYSYTFAPVTIGSTWVASKLMATALLIDNNPANPTYGYVLNSINTESGKTPPVVIKTGVANVNKLVDGINVFPNPASQDLHVQFVMNATSTVSLSIIDELGRTVFTVPTETMGAGAHQMNMSTNDMAAGVYTVVLHTGDVTTTQRLSVVK